jgi:GNAT superfamily N-acetyltransferase
MIRKLASKDTDTIYKIINLAARAYEGLIPDDCYHQPYMPKQQLCHEMKNITFFGWEQQSLLIGVMGFQPIKDVTLLRHAYVLPDYQGRGIGGKLVIHLKGLTKTSNLLVGTWSGASRAIEFYLRQGFHLMPDADLLLKKYWDISQRQVATSVVLRMNIVDLPKF